MLEEMKARILSYQSTLHIIRCEVCGIEIQCNEIGRPRKYCNKCKYTVHLKQMLIANKHNQRLGTATLGSHFCGNFEKEGSLIFNELRRLGLANR